jgi:hypothetical protein
MTGHDDYRKLSRARIHPTQQLHAIDTRHAHIRDHAAVLELGKLVQKNLARSKARTLKPAAPSRKSSESRIAGSSSMT